MKQVTPPLGERHQSLIDATEFAVPGVESPRRRRRRWRGASTVLPGVGAFAILLGGWQLGVSLSHVSAIELVAPSAIFTELWHAPGLYASNAWVTMQEAFWGFLIASVVALGAATLMVHSSVLDHAISPLVVMFQVTPVIALGPPLVIWLGFGPPPKIVMAALITFVPLVANAVIGFRSVDPAALELLRSVNASRRAVFVHLRLPTSLPYLFAAVRVCIGLSLVGAVVAEFISSSKGLGYIMSYAQLNYEDDKVWAAIFVLIFIGVVTVGVVTLAGNHLLRWYAGGPRNR